MSELADLKRQQGILSRKIGEAKKNGGSTESLLAEIRQVSVQIKQLESAEKQEKIAAKEVQTKGAEELKAIPALFKVDSCETDFNVGELNVRLCSDDDKEAWQSYVKSKSTASYYHQWEMREVVHKSFGHSVYYYAAFDRDGVMRGVLPLVDIDSALFGHFSVSMPFFNYGGPLADSVGVESLLIDKATSEASQRGVGHVELRLAKSLSNYPTKTNKVSMVLELPESEAVLWQQIGTKVRAQVKKADRSDLKIRFGGQELLQDFYRVFAENMRDLGTPVYGKYFFENILGSDKDNLCSVGVVYAGNKPVSCCFLIGYGEMLEIPWASTLKSANKVNANMFLYWNVLSRSIEQGYRFFDFGRSSSDASTFRFKKQWGAQPYQQYWAYWLPGGGELPELNPNNPKYKLLIAIWKKLPVWLSRFIGPKVVKYLP